MIGGGQEDGRGYIQKPRQTEICSSLELRFLTWWGKSAIVGQPGWNMVTNNTKRCLPLPNSVTVRFIAAEAFFPQSFMPTLYLQCVVYEETKT